MDDNWTYSETRIIIERVQNKKKKKKKYPDFSRF